MSASPERVPELCIPDDLTELDQWVMWRSEIRGGSRTKVPCQISGEHASTTDSSTWVSYEQVVAAFAAEPNNFAGVGFVFTPNDPFTGIDFDDCLQGGRLSGMLDAGKRESHLFRHLYVTAHGRARLAAKDDKLKSQLSKDSRLARLRRLSTIELMHRQQLSDYQNRLGGLRTCFALTHPDLHASPVCPHCNFRLVTEPDSAPASQAIKRLEDELDRLHEGWTRTFLNNLEDPTTKRHPTRPFAAASDGARLHELGRRPGLPTLRRPRTAPRRWLRHHRSRHPPALLPPQTARRAV